MQNDLQYIDIAVMIMQKTCQHAWCWCVSGRDTGKRKKGKEDRRKEERERETNRERMFTWKLENCHLQF